MNEPRVACYATVPFQFRALQAIATGFPQSLLSLDAAEVKAWKPDVIVVTAEHEIPLFRDFCTAQQVALVALRHGAGNKYIAPCREYALADYICGSEWDQQDFRRGGVVPLKEFLLTGNPWVDETFRLPPHSLNHERPTVLFAPTWNPQTSAARLLSDRLVPLVREAFPRSRVAIRPHPNILTHDHPSMRPHAPLFQQWIAAWRKATEQFPNVQFIDDPRLSISELFADADVLVSDGSSLIYEFAALERPILLYTSGEMPDFGEIDPLALANRYRDVGAEFRNEEEFIQSLHGTFMQHEQTHRARQRQLADELFGKYRDGRSAERVIEAIRTVAGNNRPPAAEVATAEMEPLLREADAEYAAKRFDHARKQLVEALALAPHHLETIVALANVEIARQNWLGARTELALALELDPRNVPALSSLAALCVDLNQLGEAQAVLRRLLAVQPDQEVAQQTLNAIEQALNSTPPTPEGYDRIACPFCGSEDAERFRNAADIVMCRGCQTIYLRTRMKTEAMEKLYQSYADEGSHLALPKDLSAARASPWKRDCFLKEILSVNETRGPLLDIGCGWGAFLLGARENGFTPRGIELTRKSVRYANEQLGIPVVNAQFLDTSVDPNSVQAVTMIHVLEHLPQPKQAIAKVFEVLKPDGLFCGIVPNIESFCSQRQGDQWYWLDPNYHYVHYSPATLRAHLEAAGFKLERMYTARGDYDPELIRTVAGRSDDEFFKELEAKGQGEELRFFARKPKNATVAPAHEPAAAPPLHKFDWPAALDPFVCKQEGRYIYLNEEILEKLDVLAQIEPFYFQCGGAGDTLLLLSTFYDARPRSVVLSYPNSLPASHSLFEAFPELEKIYFLPQHNSYELHGRLRAFVRQLQNCRGMGATPRDDYGQEWTERTDIFKDYGVTARPEWAKQFRADLGAKRVVVAPRGSLVGMAGSKRNIIERREWPELLQFLREQGCRPVLIGTPDECADYPCPDECEDQRSYSFAEQMRQIASSKMFVGADSWGKTFAALAGVKTIVFEAIKSLDWRGQKDPSDYVFLDPWDCIQVVSGLEHFKDVLTRGGAKKSALIERRYSQTVHVAWEGSFADNGSLSHVNRELTRQLAAQATINVIRVGTGHRAEAPTRTQVTVRHGWPPNWQKPKFGKWVLIQPWEFGVLPKDWVEHLKKTDEIWAPSEYVRRVYVDSGVEPSKVKIVPNGVDPERFHPGVAPMSLPTKKSFKFLFVGGTIGRKGPDVLLDSYLKTFTVADDVCLVIKDFAGGGAYAGHTFEAQIRAAQAEPNAPEILYINEDWPAEQLPALYTACDCLVHPYRGEGFALPVLEAMACGLPVIVTAGGATDDFVPDEYAYQITATRKSIGYQAGPFTLVRPGWVLEPSLEGLCERLRWAAAHRDEARAKGRAASDYVLREWTWQRAAQIATERLQKLTASEPSPTVRRTTKMAAIPPLPETPRLSVCVITKNEEQTLARCLNSVRGIADQIVVVDTGSTDRTVEMARENGAEVYSFAWNDDFSAARNAALEHATGDWVLTLDADEEFPSASHVELRKDTKSNAVFAYRLPLMDAGRENEGFYYVPRLFRNAPGVCYEGRIHEQVRGIAVKDWAFGKAAILHHGYTPQQQQAKNARNLRLLELALREQPEDPNLLMNLGLELARAGRLEAGIEQYALALKKLSALPPGQVVPELREALLTQLGAHLTGAKKFYEVVQLYSSRLAQRGGLTASMHFSLGIAHLQLLQFAEAEEQFRQCLAKRGKPSLCPINTDIMSAGPRHCLAVCLWKLKKTEEAEREFRSALVEDPKSRPLRFEYAMIQAVQQRPVEALKIMHELVTEKADEAFVWAAGGQIALSHPDFLEFACDWTGEAIQLFARDVFILQQRAEVLLLNGKADEALTLWRDAAGPRSVAARLICESVTGQTIESLREDEGAVSREFLNWYRRLVRWGTKGIILKLNENVHMLRNTLPTAVAALEAAFSEVQQPVIV